MNLIFDANYFFYRSLFVVSSVKNKSNTKFLDSQEDIDLFIKKVKQDFFHDIKLLNKYFNIHRILFCMDDSSWRKKLLEQYKGNRSSDREKGDVNFDVFFSEMGKLLDYFESNYGVNICKIKTAEADDIMFLLSKTFMNVLKEDSIIVTIDRDIYQLVDYNHDTGNFSVIYNNHSKNKNIVINSNLDCFLKEILEKKVNLLESFGIEKDKNENIRSLNKLVLNTDLSFDIVDRQQLIESKIFLGDSSDNIPNVYRKEIEGKKRPKQITKTTLKKLDEVLDLQQLPKVDRYTNFEKNLSKFSFELSKILNLTEEEKDELEKNIERNGKLVILDERFLPDSIKEDFLEKSFIDKVKNSDLKIKQMIEDNDEEVKNSKNSSLIEVNFKI